MNRPKEISSLAVLSTVIFCFAAPPAFADRVRARLDVFRNILWRFPHRRPEVSRPRLIRGTRPSSSNCPIRISTPA
jgi:hypothetical protein